MTGFGLRIGEKTLRIHKNNPLVLIQLAHIAESAGDAAGADGYYRKAIDGDPKNIQYYIQYYSFRKEHQNHDNVREQIVQLSGAVLDGKTYPRIEKIYTDIGTPLSSSPSSVLAAVKTKHTPEEFLAKHYYYTGLLVLHQDPETTRVLWAAAKDISPEWGHFSVEYASLEHHIFNNPESAQDVLRICETRQHPREQCRNARNSRLPQPGALQNLISVIPHQ